MTLAVKQQKTQTVTFVPTEPNIALDLSIPEEYINKEIQVIMLPVEYPASNYHQQQTNNLPVDNSSQKEDDKERKRRLKQEMQALEKEIKALWKGKNRNVHYSPEEIDAYTYDQ